MFQFKRLQPTKENNYISCYGWQNSQKLSNGQIIQIFFIEENERGSKRASDSEYYIYLLIANKKKHVSNLLRGTNDCISERSTGKCGLEGLIWARKQLIAFEQSYHCPNGCIIRIDWTDNRRRNTYERALKSLGFYITYRHGSKCLIKKINKTEEIK